MTSVNTKKDILALLKQEQERWEKLLAGWSEAEITAAALPGGWSVKDVMGHLTAWQQRTRARLTAALLGREPVMPNWPEGLDPENEEDVQKLNDWFYETQRERPWAGVYRDWREGFNEVLSQGEAVPEGDLLQPGRYPWLNGYSLADILLSTLEHHQEHYGWVEEAIRGRGVPGT